MQFISGIYATQVYQFLVSLSYKVNYFDFAVFEILLMRSKFISSVSCLQYSLYLCFDQGFEFHAYD